MKLEQGTPEWHEWRKTVRGASEAMAVLGVSKFMPHNMRELAEVKLGIRSVYYNNAMRDGNKYEERARELASAEFFLDFQPECFQLGNLGASLDGIYLAVIIEIKVSALPLDELVAYYMPQIQQQLLVSNAQVAHMVAYRKETDTIEVSMGIYPDKELQRKIVEAWDEFDTFLANYKPQEVNPLAMEYYDITLAINELETQREAIKTQLLEQGEYKDDYVSVYKSKGRQTIDYKKAIADINPEFDLTPYTKVGADSWSVRVANIK